MRVNVAAAKRSCRPFYAVINRGVTRILAGFTSRGEARTYARGLRQESYVARVVGKNCGKLGR